MLSDYPKMQCPFIRKEFKVNRDDWKNFGKKFQLRKPKVYLIINNIKPGFEWVSEDPETFVTEKLDGTNVKLRTEKGCLVEPQNRKNVIDPLQIVKGKSSIVEAVFRSIQKGYIGVDGIQSGEVIGPKIQGNPYYLISHLSF